MKRHFLCAIALLVAVTGCEKSKTTPVSTQTKIGACSLITNDEVTAIENSTVTETKPSEQADGKFRYAQCFYTTEVFNKSVSLALTEPDSTSASARDPKESWKDSFGRYEGTTKKGSEADEEKKRSLNEQEGPPPKKIEGVGDSAWWTSNRVGGALYVLKKNAFIRVSVGGPDSEDEKIERAKKLAAKAVSRM